MRSFSGVLRRKFVGLDSKHFDSSTSQTHEFNAGACDQEKAIHQAGSKTLSGRHFYSDVWNWSNSRKLVQPNHWLEHWHVQNAICQIQILSIATKNPFDSLWDSCHPRIVFCETVFWFTFRVWQRAVTSKSFGCGLKLLIRLRYSKLIGTQKKRCPTFNTRSTISSSQFCIEVEDWMIWKSFSSNLPLH